jgi:hypothetical protein
MTDNKEIAFLNIDDLSQMEKYGVLHNTGEVIDTFEYRIHLMIIQLYTRKIYEHGLSIVSLKARKFCFEMDEVISVITDNISAAENDLDKVKWNDELDEAILYIQDMEKQWLVEALEIFHKLGGCDNDPILVGDDITPDGILVRYEDISKIQY